jgi:DNA-binding transcriptional LysR family regulator
MEPQPLNFQIKQFERELGFRLFHQRERRTHLTAAGAAFLREVEPIFTALAQAVERAAQVARGEAGVLRIAFPTPLAHPILAPAIQRFRSNNPDSSFELQKMSHADQLEALRAGKIDVGLGILPQDAELFEVKVIARARPVVAVPFTDALAGEPFAPWAALNGRDAVMLDATNAAIARPWIDDMLARRNVELRELQSVTDTESALAFASAGLGITIVVAPVGARPKRTDVTFVDLPPDAGEMDVGALWLRGDENALRDKFLKVLGTVADEAGSRIHKVITPYKSNDVLSSAS